MPNELKKSVVLSLRKADTVKCAAQHFGTWAIETAWFRAAVENIRSGMLKPMARVPGAAANPFDDGDDGEALYDVQNGIALISMEGQMTKRGSSFGGCSTVQTRQAVRAASDDAMVRGIMLVISSPGGSVAGTSDLGDDVAAAGELKPVYAYVEDMACSAAYWVASQCDQIYSNKTAVIGSIGTMVVLEDDTAQSEQVGIKYTVVSTSKKKGLGADGAVTPALVSEVQQLVDGQNAQFLAAVAAGRGRRIPDMTAAADGGVYVAPQALALGLIDKIASLDDGDELNPPGEHDHDQRRIYRVCDG